MFVFWFFSRTLRAAFVGHFYCVIDFLCRITTPQSLCRAVINVSNGQQFAANMTLKDQQALRLFESFFLFSWSFNVINGFYSGYL